jgi:hypothetical protein
MIRTRHKRALVGGLIVVLLLVSGSAAYAAGVIRKYSGKTSQHQPITFQTSHSFLTHLQFRINDKCPSGHIWRIHDFNFPKIHISKSHFDQKFVSTTSKASAEVKGKVGTKKVTGTVTERRFIKKEHHFCSGTAKFTASRVKK